MNKELSGYINARIDEFDQIEDPRIEVLQDLAQYISKKSSFTSTDLIFICTHNSRRSHMSQIWAQIAAYHYRIKNIKTYSGGTDATAFYPRAVAALKKAGIVIEQKDSSANPKYLVSYTDDTEKITAFSKKYSDPFNPQKKFCAVMTCSDADEACPVVFGAEKRISLPYTDPKKYDGTAEEEAKYDERCRQIAREMFFVFSRIKQ